MSKVLPLIAALACSTIVYAAAAADPAASVNVRTAMVAGVNPAAVTIWDLGNEALDDDGQPDPSRLDADKLAGVREAAQTMAVYADLLANARAIVAAGPDLVGGKVPEGVASREQIQAAIDADPAGFRQLAAAMGDEADAIVAAIDSGDTAAVAERVATFDGACASCHERYWYVQQ